MGGLQRKAKWKNKIAVQICVIILITNLLTLLFCFAFQNMSIQQILLKNSEKESVKSFEQSEYNIKNFCEQVDLVSRKLSVDANLRSISRYGKLSEKDKLIYSSKLIRSFGEEMTNYTFIKSISFIGANGILVSAAPNGNYVKYEMEKTDWFYNEEINEKIKSEDMSLKWFGGYTDKDFQIYNEASDKSKKIPYITAFRSTLAGAGKLIINVSMEDFFRVFCLDDDQTDETVYMIDDSGKIRTKTLAQSFCINLKPHFM